MDKIGNVKEWIISMEAGDVRYGSLMRGRVGSMRSIVSLFNKTIGYERKIYIHAHYDWFCEVAVFICVTIKEHLKESQNTHDNEWKKKIPKYFD